MAYFQGQTLNLPESKLFSSPTKWNDVTISQDLKAAYDAGHRSLDQGHDGSKLTVGELVYPLGKLAIYSEFSH